MEEYNVYVTDLTGEKHSIEVPKDATGSELYKLVEEAFGKNDF